MANPKTLDVVVSGVVVTDHHIYEGERYSFAGNGRDLTAITEPGGAALVQRLLQQLAAPADAGSATLPAWRIHLGVSQPDNAGPHAYALWRPCAKAKSDEVWRTERLLGFGETGHAPVTPDNTAVTPRILVLDEAGQAFRSKPHSDLWHLPKRGAPPDWIVLKMAGPIARGDLWFELTEHHADRLVCVISADDLRQECVNLSLGLSWERTLDEILAVVAHNPALARLDKCRHLIVRFRTDGAVWIDRNDRERPRIVLIYDAGNAEGSWESQYEGGSIGYSSALTASLAFALMQHVTAGKDKVDLAPAIDAGLRAARDLLESGHGPADTKSPCGFPAARLTAVIQRSATGFSQIAAPFPATGKTLPKMAEGWSIVEQSQHPVAQATPASPVGLAQQIVLKGFAAFKRFPHATFGAMTTLDRVEIEALRGIKHLMLDYQKDPKAKKPLSIGVFGPPGAGKSFGVKQLANEVFGKQAWIEFNLAQFDGPDDLMGAFHQVRDIVLSGLTPVVFWDEFDSQELKWLQYLLAPMQDGHFQEGQLNHAVGKCVFVFAGGTSATFADFGRPSRDPMEAKRFRLLKGPDFHSRLDAFYNVLGPNQRQIVNAAGKLETDPLDVCHPLRRALLIRALMGCKPDDPLDFDSDLLNALLLVPRYNHGARSLEKLVAQLKPPHGGAVRRSNLPAAAQLAMHVDAEAFHKILNRNESFRLAGTTEPLARAIHAHWRLPKRAKSAAFDKAFDRLDEVAKEDNRAAARRIPEVLALAGMRIAGAKRRTSDPNERTIREHIEHHLEILAEAEHDGWMDHRMKNGWRLGARDNDKRLHPLLIPYKDLPEPEKDKDRSAVRDYPDMVAMAGCRIVWA